MTQRRPGERRPGQPENGVWYPSRHWFNSELEQEETRLQLGERLAAWLSDARLEEPPPDLYLPRSISPSGIAHMLKVKVPLWMSHDLLRDVVRPRTRRITRGEVLAPEVPCRMGAWLDAQRERVAALHRRRSTVLGNGPRGRRRRRAGG